jgi:O-acetyl-ADP-ribose deacetylase (regulator of RNase III)
MPVKYVTGNLLEAPETVIMHGCNAQGVMGSGVARQIRALHPIAYEVYREAYDTRTVVERGLPLGSFSVAQDGDRTIVNAVTQEFFGRDPDVVYVSYDAITRLCESLAQDPRFAGVDIAIPRIGAGLANGRWEIIEGILARALVSFVVYTPPVEIAP